MTKYILTLLIFIYPCLIRSQSISISDIPTLKQLPVSAIHRVFRDSEGYMWYGTVNGLCRDDGYNIQVFRSDIKTPRNLKDDLIECIAEDKDGRIWFGTDKGAYILNKTDYNIEPLDPVKLQDKQIMSIYATSDDFIWVGYYGALCKYDTTGKLLKEYPINNKRGKANISGFCESRNKEILICIWNGGVYHLDKQKDAFIPYTEKNILPTLIIQDAEHDYFWLATWGSGIVRFDPTAPEDSMCVFNEIPENSLGQKDGLILHIAQDNNLGYIWATTSRNLIAFKPQPDGILKQVTFPPGLLPTNHMLVEILKGKDCLWVSAFDRQSFIIHLSDNIMQDYALPSINQRTKFNPAIMALCDDGDDDILWMLQERTGLLLYNLKTDDIHIYTDFPELESLPLNAGREMTRAYVNKGIWMASDGSRKIYGLSRQGMRMQREDALSLEEYIPSTSFVNKLYEDTHGNLWIGSTNGLCIYDIKERKIKYNDQSLGHITGIAESREGILWVCTKNKGLYQVSHHQGSTKFRPSLQDYNFSSISIAPDGTLWLGTFDGGVYAYEPTENKLTNYSNACGMNGNQVNQIAADAFNHIWIDTNQKLIEFNPRNSSFRTYLTTDGSILLKRFLPTAICMGQDGNIYFGGIPGICRVTPSNGLDRKASIVKTKITDIKLLGTSLIFNDKKEENSFNYIQLRPEDQNLEICFSSLNHRYASKIRYAYRLKGIDKDWVYVEGGKNSAFYNHLAKGSYTFQVKATDENGVWSNEITELAIERLPAFYETWWAYLFYILIVLGFSSYSLHTYLKRIERKNNEIWADSQEMMKMRTYLDSEINLVEPEFQELDKLFLEKAVKAVEDNLTQPNFDVNALASAMNMSRSTLTRKLKTISNRTPLDFIRNIKMKHARHMLEDKNKNVTEVAATLGYFNRKYFTACFKEEFGMTPSEYQKTISH